MKATELAKGAATAIAPELAVPAQLAFKLARPKAQTHPPVVVQPGDRAPLLRFGKDKLRVRTKGGVRVLTVERAPSLTIGEGVAVAAVAGTAYVAWKVDQELAKLKGTAPTISGYGGIFPGANGWGPIKW